MLVNNIAQTYYNTIHLSSKTSDLKNCMSTKTQNTPTTPKDTLVARKVDQHPKNTNNTQKNTNNTLKSFDNTYVMSKAPKLC
jgi:hypothetical protein